MDYVIELRIRWSQVRILRGALRKRIALRRRDLSGTNVARIHPLARRGPCACYRKSRAQMDRLVLATIVSAAAVTVSVGCGGMTDGRGHSPLANSVDSSVTDASVRDRDNVRPGKNDASQ